jgi:hypothetical protein
MSAIVTEKFRVTKLGLAAAVLLFTFFALFQPLIACGVLCFGIVTIAFYILSIAVEQVSILLAPIFLGRGKRASGWQFGLGAIVMALTILRQTEIADAQFFNNLEAGLKTVIGDSGSGIDEGIITTIFVFFRIIVALAFVTGIVISLTLSLRGGDWQPLASVMGIGVGFVVLVEVMSTLILGAGGGGGGAGGAGGGGGGVGVGG